MSTPQDRIAAIIDTNVILDIYSIADMEEAAAQAGAGRDSDDALFRCGFRRCRSAIPVHGDHRFRTIAITPERDDAGIICVCLT